MSDRRANETDAEARRSVLDLISQALNEVRLGAQLMSNNVSLLDHAMPPHFPIKPRRRLNSPSSNSNKSRRRLKGLIQKPRNGLVATSGLVRMTPRLLRLLGFTKSLSKTRGLTRRAMTTILSLIEGFLTRLEVPRKHLADGPSRRLRVFLEITLGAVVGERFDSPRAKSQSRRNWVCR